MIYPWVQLFRTFVALKRSPAIVVSQLSINDFPISMTQNNPFIKRSRQNLTKKVKHMDIDLEYLLNKY